MGKAIAGARMSIALWLIHVCVFLPGFGKPLLTLLPQKFLKVLPLLKLWELYLGLTQKALSSCPSGASTAQLITKVPVLHSEDMIKLPTLSYRGAQQQLRSMCQGTTCLPYKDS